MDKQNNNNSFMEDEFLVDLSEMEFEHEGDTHSNVDQMDNAMNQDKPEASFSEIDEEEDDGLYRNPGNRFENKNSRGSRIGENRQNDQGKGGKIASIIFLIAVFVVAAVASYFLIFGHSDRLYDEYYNKAMSFYNGKNYTRAASELIRAEKSAHSDAKILKAKDMRYTVYMKMLEYEKALNVLDEMIQIDKQEPTYYAMKISTYQQMGDEKGLKAFKESIAGTAIEEKLTDYLVSDPQIDVKPGKYKKPITVTITNPDPEHAKVYYTTDGSKPDQNSTLYEKPLVFGTNKKFDLKVVAINDKGIRSRVVSNYYQIRAISAPKVTPASGDFQDNTKIQVTVPDGCKAYYTLDGSVPDQNSARYTKALDMPAGNNLFSVVVYNSANARSSVVTRIYNLKLTRTYTYNIAYERLVNTLLQKNILQDTDGTCKGGKITFEYLETAVVEGQEYYIVQATKKNDSGKMLGQALYGIGTQQCDVFRMDKDKKNQYSVNADLNIPKN